MDNVRELVARYREAAMGHADPNPKKANKWHDALHAYYKVLRETEEGRQSIISLMDDAERSVRCWAAAHSLQWEPELARRVLEDLRDSTGPYSLSAEMTLAEYDKGRLTFDY